LCYGHWLTQSRSVVMDATHLEDLYFTRREFVHVAVAFGSGLALAAELPAEAAANGQHSGIRPPSAFLQITPDNLIALTAPAIELGQGGHTSVATIMMEELDGDWRLLRVQDAPAAAVYNNPVFGAQITGGDFTVRGWYVESRRIGAAARQMLMAAAAHRWGVPAGECSTAKSVVYHHASGRYCTFGSVATAAAQLSVPQDPPLKPASEWTLIGKSPERVDVGDKVNGRAVYGIDVRLPGMLYAAVKACPTFGGKVRAYDDAAARQVPGYHTTVALPDAIVIVARSYWQAKKAIDQVKMDYDFGSHADLDSAGVSAKLQEGLNEAGALAYRQGDVVSALGGAGSRLEAVYEVPYLAHACMEPMNCTARVDAHGCDLWCSNQAPQKMQAAAAEVLGISADRVRVHSMYVGGGFGRRGETDFVRQAVAAAKAAGQPVKLLWSREEDIQHDFYRPAAAIRFRARVDGAGRLVALDCAVVTAAADNGLRYTEFVDNLMYAVPNARVTGLNKNCGIPFGYWRSVNASHNTFMVEGFIDEVARHSQQDPYRFRRSMLQHPQAKRQLAVLDLVAQKADWDHPVAGHSLGIAMLAGVGGFDSFIGTVADISIKNKVVRLHRVVTVIDCGIAIHPDNVKGQLEGAMVFGLTAALRGEITVQGGAVMQGNFDDYPMLTMGEMPSIECYVMPSSEAPGGAGEIGVATIAPALTMQSSGRRAHPFALSHSQSSGLHSLRGPDQGRAFSVAADGPRSGWDCKGVAWGAVNK
jgi:isoquinoline 1-oxidoreductase beta subunit